jgi:hypothetical protein
MKLFAVAYLSDSVTARSPSPRRPPTNIISSESVPISLTDGRQAERAKRADQIARPTR